MFSTPIPSKADVRLLRSLGRKKFREEYGLFTVEGDKSVQEALNQSKYPVEAVYRTAEIGEKTMAEISHLSTPSPALAVLRIPKQTAPAPTPLPCGPCLALHSVRDPGNVGTILRIADWFGMETVYLSEDCADLYNPKTVQATMGSIFRQHTAVCDLNTLAENCINAEIPVYATVLHGKDIRKTRILSEQCLILIGSERDGLSEELIRISREQLTIPSFAAGDNSGAESLNVAIATAVVCYELRRGL